MSVLSVLSILSPMTSGLEHEVFSGHSVPVMNDIQGPQIPFEGPQIPFEGPQMNCNQPYWSWSPVIMPPFSVATMNCNHVNSFSFQSSQLEDLAIQVVRNGKHQWHCDGVDFCSYSRFQWFDTDSYQIIWYNPTNYTREIRFIVDGENTRGWDIAFTAILGLTTLVIVVGLLGLVIWVLIASIKRCKRRKFDYHLIDADAEADAQVEV